MSRTKILLDDPQSAQYSGAVDKSTTCIVIPCYNEEKRFDGEPMRQFSSETGIHFLLVNDGSKDKTLEVLEGFKSDTISVLDLPQNGGKAEAVRAGVNKALEMGFKEIAFWDADWATPLSEIPLFLEELKGERLAVTGARILRLGGNIDRKRSRHLFGRLFATTVSILLDLPVYDTQCGAKMFRAELAAKVFDKPFRSPWFFDVEILFRAKKLGVECRKAFYEKPLTRWVDVDGSKLKKSDFIKVPFEILKIYFRYR